MGGAAFRSLALRAIASLPAPTCCGLILWFHKRLGQ